MKEKASDETPLLHPRHSERVEGHSRIEQILLRQFLSNQLPGAYLFTGPKGIGKASMAYRFARFLMSQSAEVEPAGLFGDALPPIQPTSLETAFDSPISKRIALGSHPDLMTIEPVFDEKKQVYKDEILVSAARDMGNFMGLTRVESPWKVIIIDAAEQMNNATANAILKWLEEPPANTLLMLISHNPGKLLPTIRSRCRRLTFSPPGLSQFESILQRLLPESSMDERETLYFLAGGSPGLAITLYTQDALKCYNDILDKVTPAGTGAKLPPLFPLADKYAAPKGDDALSWDSFSLVFERIVKQAASLASGGAGEERLRGLATSKPLSHWLGLWDYATQILKDAENLYLDRRHVFAVLMATLGGQLEPAEQ